MISTSKSTFTGAIKTKQPSMKIKIRSGYFLPLWFALVVTILGSGYWITNNTRYKKQQNSIDKIKVFYGQDHMFVHYTDLFFHSGNNFYLQQLSERISQSKELVNELSTSQLLADSSFLPINTTLEQLFRKIQFQIKQIEEYSVKYIEPDYANYSPKTWSNEQIKTIEQLRNSLLRLETDLSQVKITLEKVDHQRKAYANNINSGMIALIMLVLFLAYVHINKTLLRSIKPLISYAQDIEKGNLNAELTSISKDLAPVQESLKNIADHIQHATEFAIKIGEGKLDVQMHSTSGGDYLGNALMEMRNKLQSFSEEEKKRNWAITGIARFSDIFRQNQHAELHEMCYQFVFNLVKYLNGNQGGVFLINEDDPHDKFIELYGCYAYERRKQLEKRVEWGEGLIGQCILEKDMVYIEEVPESYIHITSGLGKKKPTCILLVPVKINEEIFGAVEIAFFNLLEPYQIKFVETVCETFAATLSSTKMNLKTKKLLDESQALNEEMQQKEEEMRQNAEELETTQETLNRKLRELEEETNLSNNIIEAINKTNANIEFDMEGNVLAVNDMYLSVMGYTRKELIGINEIKLAPKDEIESQRYKMLWDSLRSGSFMSGEYRRLSKGGREIWLNGTYNPIFDLNGNPYKVIQLAQFTTEEKEKDLDLTNKINAMSGTFPLIELDIEGNIKNANQEFINLLGYKRTEFRNKPLWSFADTESQERSGKILGETQETHLNFVAAFNTFDGKVKHCLVNYNRLKNLSGETSKYLVILIDISEQKELEYELVKNQFSLESSIEELNQAKEEITKRKNELEAHINVLNKASNIMELDANGNIISANPSVCNLFTAKKSALLGTDFKTHLVQEEREDQWNICMEQLKSGKLVKMLLKFKKADNHFFWGETMISPVMDSDQLNKMIVVVFDTTAQMRLNQELKESLVKERVRNAILQLHDEETGNMDKAFESLMQILSDDARHLPESELVPVMEIDQKGQILTKNNLSHQLFELEDVPVSFGDLLKQAHGELPTNVLKRILKGNVVKHLLKIRPGKENKEALMITVPLFNDQNESMKILVLFCSLENTFFKQEN